MKHQVAHALLLAAVSAGAVSADESPWLTDYDKAKSVAKQKNAPMFVVFR